jgi:hypothetical protein
MAKNTRSKRTGRKPAKAKATRPAARKAPSRKKTAARARVPRSPFDALLAPISGSTARVIGGVTLDAVRAGAARVKRMIYPAGFRWSQHMKPVTGTDRCMHAHVGFLAKGEIHIEYADGCIIECRAPQVVAIDPGHDGWVVGSEPVVLIEFDFERETVNRLGMPDVHRH